MNGEIEIVRVSIEGHHFALRVEICSREKRQIDQFLFGLRLRWIGVSFELHVQRILIGVFDDEFLHSIAFGQGRSLINGAHRRRFVRVQTFAELESKTSPAKSIESEGETNVRRTRRAP